MPKRAPTPPHLDNDADYYTVYQPYPLNFDWDIHTDVLKHVRWIAACVGIESFQAFHYKPKAPSMVIAEIKKEKENAYAKARFLGEHRWNEILRRPTLEERERVTQVFPCSHNNNRSVVKDGWHRIAVNDDWFKGWSVNQDFVEPYPSTHHCVPPNEDRTNKPLCRPLPTIYKPPPPPPAKPVVGSATWVNAKTNTGPSTGPVLQGTGRRGRGGINISTRISGTNPKAPPSLSQEASSGNPLAVVSRGPAPARPPGLPANPWNKVPATSGVMQTGSGTSFNNATQEDSLDKQVARISLTENREVDVYTLGDGLDDEDPVVAMFVPRYETEAAVSPGDGTSGENLWSAVDDTSAASVPLCPLHGRPNCKPGICKAADRQRKLEQAEQRRRGAEQARASNRGAGRGRGRRGRGGHGRGGSASNNQSSSFDPWS
ncbi:hypothetical protein IW261DRAFT_1592838 [Armillaria novae-zelandiae]|uniref:Uncharacterized protein n=1 Tax=Armillaria novae-zelandiae TaxID=153914 RepID=A0AA39UA61_9AGAR|nr:hypothetical protein IW261DRAFT_1592838 [Armillaria novae-zelandiae]